MRVIIIGEKYLDTHMNLAHVTTDPDSQQYTSFDPTRDGYVHLPVARSCVSQMKNMSSYLNLFRDLKKAFAAADVLDVIKLATYHDLITFLAVSYRTSMRARLSLQDARRSAVDYIGRFLNSVAHALLHNVIRTAMCIAKTVVPAPESPMLEPQHQQHGLSLAVMSASPAGYIPFTSKKRMKTRIQARHTTRMRKTPTPPTPLLFATQCTPEQKRS